MDSGQSVGGGAEGVASKPTATHGPQGQCSILSQITGLINNKKQGPLRGKGTGRDSQGNVT